MKKKLYYILILFLFASTANATAFAGSSSELTEECEEIELKIITKDNEITRKKYFYKPQLKKEKNNLTNNPSIFIHQYEHSALLYIMFGTFLV